ncbi:hypothetical protein CLV63_1106 [Murinocardiopsis flavida]|uniref:Uncharacterized protein n=1 Tax=Murinocardiopsis flavida TaxID=645275 RepID=A0A2P8DHP9_9ACTN|nr:hypothetical protein [Murinocardiopsis flavida]PSK96709.1 hypothetical protein CLV63_1106 [Murinocardiopsis flavida]
MPCYLCGARQPDPAVGDGQWKRGVRSERQVLVCAECQLTREWKADLDRCGRCRSTFLLSRLGEVECHTCGAVRTHTAHRTEHLAADPALTDEVERALERVLGGPGRLGAARAH